MGVFKKNKSNEVEVLISKASDELSTVRFTEKEQAQSHCIKAVQIMRDAVAIDKKNSRAWEFLCRALLGIGEMEEAKEAWKKARSLEKDEIFSFTPFNNEIATNYPIMLEELGEIRIAELVRKSYTAASPEIPELWLDLSNFYGRIGNRDQQILTLVNAARSTGDMNLYIALIELLVGAQAYKAAEDAANEAIQKNPETPMAWSMKGWVYVEAGQPEKSIEFYQKAIEINPDDFEARYRLAFAFQQLGRTRESKDLADDLTKKHPENTDAWNLLGGILYEQGKLNECETAFRKAMELLPQDPIPLGNLIHILKEQGKNQEIGILEKRLKELG